MLTDGDIEKIKAKLEGAFAPLRCVVEIFDYKQKVRFMVFDNNDEGVLEIKDVVLRHLNDAAHIQDLIEDARARLQVKGLIPK